MFQAVCWALFKLTGNPRSVPQHRGSGDNDYASISFKSESLHQRVIFFLFVVVNVNLSQIGNYKHRLAGLDIKF